MLLASTVLWSQRHAPRSVRGPHRLQHLLSRAVWDDQQILDIAAGWAAGAALGVVFLMIYFAKGMNW